MSYSEIHPFLDALFLTPRQVLFSLRNNTHISTYANIVSFPICVKCTNLYLNLKCRAFVFKHIH